MTTPIHKRARSWFINGALAAGGLVTALLLAEIGLRVVGFSDPLLWTYDDVTGSKLRPGARGWQRREGEAFITISADGLRDREHSKTKPPNTVRVAILGASMAEALQVPLENTFASILERGLKSCRVFGDRDVEVMNFGVSGFGTAQELLTFRGRAAAYSPDITVLAFTPAFDVRNNSKELEPLRLSPFFSIQEGKLVLDNSFLTDPEYVSFKSNFDERKIFFDLRTFQLVRRLKLVLQQRRSGQAGAERDAVAELGQDGSEFLPPTTKAWTTAWQITEQLIVAIRDEVVARGGRFLLVSIPVGIQVDPDPEMRSNFMRTIHVDDLWYPETRTREFAEKEAIDALTLNPTFQAYAERNHVYMHGFKNTRLGSGHLNEAGHKLIGEALAKHLCQSP
jgi:hypothetical protein